MHLLFVQAAFVIAFMPGHMELLIVAGIFLLLFGHRLPSLMRSLGRGVVEFKRGVHGLDDDEDDVADEPAPARKSED